MAGVSEPRAVTHTRRTPGALEPLKRRERTFDALRVEPFQHEIGDAMEGCIVRG